MSGSGDTLPGLDGAGKATNAMLRAATAHVEYLKGQGLIQGHHTLTVELVLGLAEVIGKAAAKGQAAAMAMGAKQLMEAMEMLPAPQAEGDAWAKMMAQMAATDNEESNA